MSGRARARRRSFLDATGAETTTDLGTLGKAVSEVARDAERLGLTDVEGHLDAALDGVERADVQHEA